MFKFEFPTSSFPVTPAPVKSFMSAWKFRANYPSQNAGFGRACYIFDYVILIACVIGFWILDSVEPYHQHFSLRNYTLQYPYAVHERIPIQYALCISGAFPLVVIAIYTLLLDGLFSHHKPQDPISGKRKLRGPWRWKDRLWELNCGILGLLLSQALAFLITQVLKNACGKPRPDIIDRSLIKDGFRSWPSGHSSSSFAGLTYLSLWLGGKFHIMDQRGETWKTLLVSVPLLAATLVAVSRIMDARHHPFDVITGGDARESWRKGRAYPIRTWGTEPVVPGGAQFAPLAGSTENLRDPNSERLDALHPREGSVSPAPFPIASGYANQAYDPTSRAHPRRSHDHHPDGNYSSSEEDVGDGYEMQSGYPMGQIPLSNPYAQPFEANTAYPSQTPAGRLNDLESSGVVVGHSVHDPRAVDPAHGI
ncbi:hypothetical protein N7470_004836 [Penicillium chermesinum]|nr:hypothetical protein N7470_004836 [Penicillium chermesinum]